MPYSRQNAFRCWVLGILIACISPGLSQTNNRSNLSGVITGGTPVVRIFYQPAGGGYFHSALLFRVVNEDDPKLNTAPIFKDGRTAYISLKEMMRLEDGLVNSGVDWEHSAHVTTPPTVGHYVLRNKMEITIYSSKGTAQAFLSPPSICSTLGPLDSAFSTPRALWEFQLFRFKYHCKIQGFNPNAYPQRDIVNK